MRNIPGLVAGYWLAAKDGEGLTLLLFENEQGARAVAEALPEAPRPEFASLAEVDLREVAAQI